MSLNNGWTGRGEKIDMIKRKRIGVGIENFKEMVDKDYYYADKTLFIKDLLDKGGKVNLFTRPRRFGKTLALSMIKTFFEAGIDVKGNAMDNAHYFNGMKIMEEGESYTGQMGRYPVIDLSLKSAKQPDFRMAYACLVDDIGREFVRHRYVLEGDALFSWEKEKYERLMSRKAEAADYVTSLQFLSECLSRYHGRNTVILIDEYDVPLESSYFKGFYGQMTDFIRPLFESSLKTNPCLEFAVITGCLRISKESIFTGLNNLKVFSVLSNSYAEHFGFTQEDVDDMLEYYGIREKAAEVKEWYDGYLFGGTEVYNPWSVINYVDDAVSQTVFFPKPYWSNTSSNSIVKELVERADAGVKNEIEKLIAGEVIEKPVHEDVTYEEIYDSQDNLWNFLFFTGYLRAVRQTFEADAVYLAMKIPNAEIRYIYRRTIREWFEGRLKAVDFRKFYEAMLDGNCEEMESFLEEQLAGSISYYGSAENFYHGYLMGILSGVEGYDIGSNKERGNGRPDIVLTPFGSKKEAVIIEIKRAAKFAQMEGLCDAALKQIEEKNYALELLEEGYGKVMKYGICFCKKSCMVKCYEG